MLSVAQREASAEERAAIDALGRSSKSVTTRAMLVTADGRSLLAELSGVDCRLAAWPARSTWARAASVPSGAEVAIGREIAERLELRPRRSASGSAAPAIACRRIIDKMPRDLRLRACSAGA